MLQSCHQTEKEQGRAREQVGQEIEINQVLTGHIENGVLQEIPVDSPVVSLTLHLSGDQSEIGAAQEEAIEAQKQEVLNHHSNVAMFIVVVDASTKPNGMNLRSVNASLTLVAMPDEGVFHHVALLALLLLVEEVVFLIDGVVLGIGLGGG